jgi:hypothetical protein
MHQSDLLSTCSDYQHTQEEAQLRNTRPHCETQGDQRHRSEATLKEEDRQA